MKKKWIIWSGEGERGTKKEVIATENGIKKILTTERCGGDRWAHACDADVGPNITNYCASARAFALEY